MIIKGIFRRYQRWNPVHPTAGAFWGMGIGVGCGVGWGPGFGPEVIGYVGAGCGAGFSVGLTLAGIGLGLPANSLLQFPFSGTQRIAENALSPARFIAARDIMRERWKQMIPQISLLTRRNGPPLSYGVDLLELMKPLTSLARPAVECLDSFISCHVSPVRDPSKSSRRSKG